MEFTAELIAGFLGGEVVGDPTAAVTTVAKIEEAKAGSLAFLANPKYEHFIYQSEASIVIVGRDFTPTSALSTTLIKVDDAYGCFAKLLELYAANKPQKSGISPLASIDTSVDSSSIAYLGEYAVIGKGVKLGKNIRIYPQVYVGDNVTLGDDVTLYPGVKIYEECVIGNRVTIHAGSVIGADGFGFAPTEDGTFHKIPQLGNVILEDDVDVGANSCIDRATMGSTIIRQGTKLDNLIQVGHNAEIGSNTVAAAQLGLAGSSKIGDNCMIGGQVGIAGHLSIGNNVKLASKTGISNNVGDDEVMMGYPAMPGTKYHRSFAVYRNLPDLSSKVRQLEKELARISALLPQSEQ